MPVSRTSSSGFTLIELSVVLVIIGLLLGAVVGGQAMIRSAELQSIVSDYTRYKEAVTTFKKQYSNSIPGDMADAEDFWGKSTVCGGASDTGACNGDGSGALDGLGTGSPEAFQFWRQLSLAGRITGSYTGGPANTYHSVIGVNVPRARISASGWEATSGGCAPGFQLTTEEYGNGFYFGGEDQVTHRCLGRVDDSTLTPEEAWKIDTKLDDGKPGRGTIMSSDPTTGCATATSGTDYDAAYNLSDSTKQCGLHFIQQF
jgi:prepilin-type N-terminal cleavage/methylation domain-containing protein